MNIAEQFFIAIAVLFLALIAFKLFSAPLRLALRVGANTALGFLAAGVGLDQLAPDFATPLIREVLALLLCLIAGVLAIYGYLRWLRNEKAMRLKQDLPYTRGLLIISTILLMVAGVVMLLVLYAG